MIQTTQYIVLVLFFLTAPLYNSKENTEDDPDIIETRSFESYRIARPPEIQKACLVEELNAYSLWGDSTSLGDPNPICPNIQQNCCGPKDQRRINYIWQTDRKRQENHHRFILKVHRYILGFGMKYYGVAKKIMEAWQIQKMRFGDGKGGNQNGGQGNQSKNEDVETNNFVITPSKFCFKHAKHVVESGFTDRKRAEAFYADLTLKVEFLENSRRGFYCSLCAGEAKTHFGTHWKMFDWLYKDRLFYDETFCQMIHEWTFRTIYTSWKSFRPYVSSIMKMLICVNPPGESSNKKGQGAAKPGRPNIGNMIGEKVKMQFSAQFVNFDLKLRNPLDGLSDDMKKIFNHPMMPHHPFKLEFCNGAVPGDFFFFTRCEVFCQKWNIAKPVSLFDGSVKKTKFVFDYLLQYEFALSNNEQNLFRDKMNDLRKIIADSYEERNYKPFYTSIATDIKIDKYHSDFLGWWEGLHPMKLTEGSPLYFEYTNAGILKALALALFAVFLF
jgi:hypothetical protein